MVLPAGTYVMKRLDPASSQNVVQFYNRNENHMYAMVLANRAYRPYRVDHTVITYDERTAGSPPAMKEWFFPDSYWGEAFVYPKAKTVAFTQNIPAPAPPAPVVTPAPAPEPQAELQPAPEQQQQTQQEEQEPEQLAQAQPAPAPQSTPAPEATQAPESTPAQQTPEELPKTASNVPLIGLFGLLSIAGGVAFRKSVA